MMISQALTLPWLYLRALNAARYARERGIPGIEFNRFGRQVGYQLLIRGLRSGLDYILVPVNITRYFEFAFALSCLPAFPGRYLDISSPRLFSCYVASKARTSSLVMANPDPQDMMETKATVSRLCLSNIQFQCSGIGLLAQLAEQFDCVWSLSVVEHISGEIDDSAAVRLMYDQLKPGGRLILSVPVDRVLWNEYRDVDYYGTQNAQSNGEYFFQRFYDLEAVRTRLISPVGVEPTLIRWFGEICPGHFSAYIKRWIREGRGCIVDDPREIADHYREFRNWGEMPGIGVCCIMIEKPL